MATDVVMPQMGESIAEGTIVRWIKKVGDQVDRDEPLFEITTDKVDAEIPSPAAGILAEITVKEGETVSVNSVVGTIQQDGEAAAPPAPAPAPEPPKMAAPAAPAPVVPATPRESGERIRSSPLVRRIARDNDVDVSQISGSGIGGRVTKHDILAFIGNQESDPGPQRPQAAPAGPR